MIAEASASLPAWWSAWALPLGAGVCLSAACGFRTFIPLLAVGLASHFGLVPMDSQYGWLSSATGLVALGTAAAFEVGGYYIPIVDHALDVIATPLATAAGALAMFTSIGSDHGLMGWLLALRSTIPMANRTSGIAILQSQPTRWRATIA